jgi:ketosteroid isomerase-like protein
MTSLRTVTASSPRSGSPRRLVLALVEALNRGDTATAASLFTVHGCFVTPDGTAVAGAAGLRAIFTQMGELGAHLEVESLGYHQAGDVCLVDGHVRYRAQVGDAESFETIVGSRIVLRQSSRGWELAIVALWGS